MLNFLIVVGLILFSFLNAEAVEWQKAEIPGSAPIYSFYKSGDDIYLGFLGIRKSNDDGLSYKYCNKLYIQDTSINISGFMKSVTDIYKSKNGTLYASAMDWPVMVSTDDGESWSENSDDIFRASDCFFEAGNTVFAFDHGRVLFSITNGSSWEELISDIDILSKNAVTINDESLVFYSNHIDTDTKFLEIYNTKSEQLTQKQISIEPSFLWADGSKLLALDNEIIYSTVDLGDNWTEEFDIKKKLGSIDQLKNDKISLMGFRAKKSILALNFYASNFDSGKNEQHMAISFDSGVNWEVADISDVQIYDHNYIKIFENKVYFHGMGVFVYNRDSNRFEDANYNFPVSMHYREFEDYSFCTLLSSSISNWEQRDDSGWHRIENDNQQYCSFNKDMYFLEDDVLKLARDGKFVDSWSNIVAFYVLRETKDFILFHTMGLDGKANFIVNYPNSGSATIRDAELLDYDENNEVCYAKYDEEGNLKLCKGKLGKPENIEILNADFLKNNHRITDLSFDGNKIIIRQNREVFITTNNGQSWTEVWGSEEEFYHVRARCHNENFYIAGTFGLLKSSDGIVWENMLENISDAYIFNYDFHPNGQIIAYTSEGVFASEKPVSVDEGKHLETPSISIFPNPAQDVICVDVDCTVDYIEIYDLSGNKLIQTELSNEVDITALQQGSYFLKIYSGEKAYFRQFIVE